MGGFWLAEGYYAFARLDYRKWGHARTNLALLGLVLLINAGFGLATLGAFRWLRASQFGLLYFGNTLSVWDRLFGTYGGIEESGLMYGVDVADYTRAGDLGYQLGRPRD